MDRVAFVRSSSMSDADCVREIDCGGERVNASDPVKKQNLQRRDKWLAKSLPSSQYQIDLLVKELPVMGTRARL